MERPDPVSRPSATTVEAVERPAVDVVVPFIGSRAALEDVRDRLASLHRRPDDSVLVVDNTPRRGSLEGLAGGTVAVLHAAGRCTPGFARNRGAACGSAEWLVFLDADTTACDDLLDRYFDPPPAARTALLGGGVVDEPVPADAPIAARYAYLRGAMSQDDTFSFGSWGYPKSANVACRRAAFEAVGGFREEIRAAEDADLTYRLKAAGWEVERREGAGVVHVNRQSVRGLIRQKAIWGAGGAALDRVYPGSVPARRRLRLLGWALRTVASAPIAGVRARDRDHAIRRLVEPLEALAFELGRSLPNERPLTARVWWRTVRRGRIPRGAPRR